MIFNSKSRIKKHFNSLKEPYTSDSKNRNRVWKFLRKKEERTFYKYIHDLKKSTCLDLGSGSCEYARVLLDKGAESVTCVDFSDSLMNECGDLRVEKVICDVEEFETEKKYDLILCVGILEFLNYPKKFMIHLKNFLKSEGKIIILLPKSYFWSFIYFSYYFLVKGIFINLLSMKRLDNFLIKKGFQLEQKITPNVFTEFAVYSVKNEI